MPLAGTVPGIDVVVEGIADLSIGTTTGPW